MNITVNDKELVCPEPCTVAQLLEHLSVPTAGTAVARNAAVVRKALYAETMLQPGDQIEIIRAVAGG